jgi:hypothetical protein
MRIINITTFDNLLVTLGCKVVIFRGFVGDSNKRLIERGKAEIGRKL